MLYNSLDGLNCTPLHCIKDEGNEKVETATADFQYVDDDDDYPVQLDSDEEPTSFHAKEMMKKVSKDSEESDDNIQEQLEERLAAMSNG